MIPTRTRNGERMGLDVWTSEGSGSLRYKSALTGSSPHRACAMFAHAIRNHSHLVVIIFGLHISISSSLVFCMPSQHPDTLALQVLRVPVVAPLIAIRLDLLVSTASPSTLDLFTFRRFSFPYCARPHDRHDPYARLTCPASDAHLSLFSRTTHSSYSVILPLQQSHHTYTHHTVIPERLRCNPPPP